MVDQKDEKDKLYYKVMRNCAVSEGVCIKISDLPGWGIYANEFDSPENIKMLEARLSFADYYVSFNMNIEHKNQFANTLRALASRIEKQTNEF